MNFENDYILKNDKILLRPLKESDFADMRDYSINEPEIWKFNSLGANGEENLRKYIETAISNRKSKTEYPFAVIHKLDNKLIGSSRFYAINIFNKTLEIGYTWYGSKYQGTEVNKMCKLLMLEFAFEELNFERVGFKANSKNERSINAMKSIGCKMEGTLRNFAKDADENRIDTVVLSIIKDEWKETKKELERIIETKVRKF